MSRYLLFNTGLTVVVLTCYFILQTFFYIHESFGWITVFFALFSVLTRSWKKAGIDPIQKVQIDLAMIVLRLIVAMVLLFLLVMIFEKQAAAISINLIVSYLIYMIFDMTLSLANLRRH